MGEEVFKLEYSERQGPDCLLAGRKLEATLVTTRSAPISICSVALGEIFRLEMDKTQKVL